MNRKKNEDKILFPLLCSIFLLSSLGLLSSPSYAGNEIERSNRLEQINHITGGPAPTLTSYQDRVDTIFDRTEQPTQERMYVNQTMPAQTSAPVQAKVEEATSTLLETLKKEKSPLQNEKGKAQARDDLKSDLSKPADQKLHVDEESYQLMNEKIKKDDAEKSRHDALEMGKKEGPGEAKSSDSEPEPSLPLSLSNNPFYFSEASRHNFEDDKTVIVGRMIQTGYTRAEAENIVMSATSPEDVVLSLMQNEGFKYGQAVELVGVAAPEADEE
ncbi:MAG: hypothetical protein EXS63_03700 [Candidatus Omnitrophica bacterium]|nr:hypothetical protein [Candidatus Omnitrophota bacterium]